MGILNWLRRFIASEPALIAWLGGGGLVSLLAFVFHFDHAKTAAAAVILAGLATIWTAVWAKPPEVALVTGALATIATAMGVFGFHPSPHLIAFAGAILAILMGFHSRHALDPWFPRAASPAPVPAQQPGTLYLRPRAALSTKDGPPPAGGGPSFRVVGRS